MFDRRRFLQSVSALPFASKIGLAAPAKRDFWKELGIRPFINAAGTYTTLTASLMPPEVVQAFNFASKQFVPLIELHDAVGKRIAELIGCEAAMVPSGAAAALTCGTAGCITGKNQRLIRQLPDTTGMKNEVIIQKSHRYGYDHAIRACGVKFVEVETAEELERAVNDRTAMMMFFNSADPIGKIKAQEFTALGKKHNIPTFNDAAADVPPVENLSKYTKMGFDLVCFSGGKGLAGPQSSAASGNGYTSMYRKLRDTYRLEWLATEKRDLLDLTLGKEHRLPLVAPDIEAAIVLREVDGEHASYEVRFLEQGKVVAQPTVKVTRGTWATIGSRDGEAAPYLFLLLGPWTADDEGLARAQKDFTLPKLINRTAPVYPEAARQARITGIVVLRGTIGVDGTVSNIRVVESPDDDLSKAAMEAFAAWRYEPGRDQKGAPVAFDYTITISFKLT